MNRGCLARHRLSRDQVIWSFGPDLQPVLEVEPGDVVTFETNDCFTGQIRSEDDLVTEIDLSRINSATGPVAVKGAEPGDSLVAEILDVRPIEWGVATLIPGFGQLIDQVQAPLTRLFEVRDGIVRMNERVSFPAKPMVGVVGVATDGETLSNGLAGQHGGNLDDHLHGKGARIFFPVRQPGGMFAVGDMHASMGDGEICFTGVEIAGEVDVRFDLLKGKQATWPVTELHDRWVPHATAADYADALQLVSEEAAKLLVDEHGFSIEDAFIFLSVACDAGVAQACKPAEGFGTIARFSIPKIDACPDPSGHSSSRTSIRVDGGQHRLRQFRNVIWAVVTLFRWHADHGVTSEENTPEVAWPGGIARYHVVRGGSGKREAVLPGSVFSPSVFHEDGNSAVFRFGETLINLLRTSEAPDLIAARPGRSARRGRPLPIHARCRGCRRDVRAAGRERGVELLNGPMDRPWGIRTASFRDPRRDNLGEIAH